MESPQVTPVPDGQRLFAYLIVTNAARAIDFYQRAFGARESYRLEMGDKIGHAEFAFEGVTIMLADEFPELGFISPRSSTAVSIVVYVADVDALAERAVAAGATLEKPVRDEFYGDRVASLRDPFGHRWLLHSRREIVTPEEMRRRLATAAS
ncbi:MAG TPA: VOC family protein [Polyangiaceae bacterium]|nr:VOC family protein [Polyangiaceae bacterium]